MERIFLQKTWMSFRMFMNFYLPTLFVNERIKMKIGTDLCSLTTATSLKPKYTHISLVCVPIGAIF